MENDGGPLLSFLLPYWLDATDSKSSKFVWLVYKVWLEGSIEPSCCSGLGGKPIFKGSFFPMEFKDYSGFFDNK